MLGGVPQRDGRAGHLDPVLIHLQRVFRSVVQAAVLITRCPVRPGRPGLHQYHP